MKCPHCHKHFTDEGRAKGGRKSRRAFLDSENVAAYTGSWIPNDAA